MKQIGYEFLIFGKVQGVGFRKFVYKKVKSISSESKPIFGSVENLSDGSVKAIFYATHSQIIELENALRVGSFLSSVEHIEKNKLDSKHQFSEFSIIK